MADFMTNTDALRQSADSLSHLKKTIDGLSSSLSSINVKSFLDSEATVILMRKISSDVAKIDRYSNVIGQMSSTLHTISRTYDKTEKGIVGSVPGKTSIQNAQSGNNNSSINVSDYLKKAVYKTVIGALGPAGLLIDAGVMIHDKNPGNVIGDIVKAAGGFAKNFDGSSVNWAKWFGLVKPNVGPVQFALNKYFDFSTLGKGISSACNWAATVITTGFSNFKEFGNFGARFWAETGVESVIKVGEAIAITAGVGAIIAAAGISAPALAIGAAAAGVTVLVDMGLDAIVTWATHGSQTSWIEAASDAICDTGEKVVNWAKDAGQKAVEWASNAAEGVGNAVSNGINSIKNTFLNIGGSGCKWGLLGR